MQINEVTFKAGGPAGAGIKTMGALFAKIMQRCNLFSYATNDYPSLIKGGHNTVTVRASSEKIWALAGPVDVLVALTTKCVKEHYDEMSENGVIIYDSVKVKREDIEVERKDLRFFDVPLSTIAKEAGGSIYYNIAAMGAVMAIMQIDIKELNKLIEEIFADKGKEVVQNDLKAAKLGYDHIIKITTKPFDIKIESKPHDQTIFLNGNDACCLGAIKAGLRLVAEYPMSPSSSVLHWMAAHAVEHDVIVKHTESEIAAINYILGAGFAGVRSMTATSGGGFALMNEALGNGGLAEIPTVIVNVMRAGPSTGVPTYTEQADLQFTLHSSQGEFPRIVCMPGDVEEAFFETFKVFNMAEFIQTPAIILLDKFLGESEQTVESFDHSKLKIDRGKLQTDEQMKNAINFLRHEVTKDGISPRCIPGQLNGIHVASSYEHDETGYSCEDGKNRIAQIDKRARKLDAIDPKLYQPSFYGDADADFLLVAWGSTKGPVLEALKLLKQDGVKVRFMHIKYAIPFATNTIAKELGAASKSLILEINSEGQMRNYIREKTGILIENTYLKYDARPFEAEGIMEKVKEIMG